MLISDWSSDVCSSDLDAAIGIIPGRRIQKTAGHHVMSARFEAEPGPDPVETGEEVLPPFRHVGALEQRSPARDEADGVTGGMAVDADEGMPHRRQAACALRDGRVASHFSTLALPSARRCPAGGRRRVRTPPGPRPPTCPE